MHPLPAFPLAATIGRHEPRPVGRAPDQHPARHARPVPDDAGRIGWHGTIEVADRRTTVTMAAMLDGDRRGGAR